MPPTTPEAAIDESNFELLNGKEALVLAGHHLSPTSEENPQGNPFKLEELIVEAWKNNRQLFGLGGYELTHPDSNKVSTRLMGDRGGPELEKVGQKLYRLTAAGRRRALELIGEEVDDTEEVADPLTLEGVPRPSVNNGAAAAVEDDQNELTKRRENMPNTNGTSGRITAPSTVTVRTREQVPTVATEAEASEEEVTFLRVEHTDDVWLSHFTKGVIHKTVTKEVRALEKRDANLFWNMNGSVTAKQRYEEIGEMAIRLDKQLHESDALRIKLRNGTQVTAQDLNLIMNRNMLLWKDFGQEFSQATASA